MKLIPFITHIPKPDEHLFERLKMEREGILAWAVLGCQLWLSDGLKEPKTVMAATSEYRDDQDEIGDYILEKCVFTSICKVYTSDLYKDYIEWAKDNGVNPLGKRRFNGKVEEKGFIKLRGTGNKPEWHGIGLKTHYQEGFDV